MGVRKKSQMQMPIGSGGGGFTGDREAVLSKGNFSLSEGGSLYSNPLFRLKNITICRSWQLIKNILKQCVG